MKKGFFKEVIMSDMKNLIEMIEIAIESSLIAFLSLILMSGIILLIIFICSWMYSMYGDDLIINGSRNLVMIVVAIVSVMPIWWIMSVVKRARQKVKNGRLYYGD